MTYGIRKSKSLPSFNEDRFKIRKRSRSCDDLRDELEFCENKKDYFLNKAIEYTTIYNDLKSNEDNLDLESKNEMKKNFNLREKANADMNVYLSRINEISKELIDKSNFIGEIYQHYNNNARVLDEIEKIKYLKKIIKLNPKNEEEANQKENLIKELQDLEKLFFENENENEKELLNSCIYNNFKKFQSLIANLDLNTFSKKTLSKVFKSACVLGNYNIVKILIENKKIKNLILENEDNTYLIDSFRKVCLNNHIDILKILINDIDIKNKILECYYNSIADTINQTCANENDEILKILFNDEDFLNVLILKGKNHILNICERDITCFRAGILNTSKQYIEAKRIRETMMKYHYMSIHIEAAISSKVLNVLNLILNHSDIKEYMKQNNKLLMEFKKALIDKNFDRVRELLINNDELIKELKINSIDTEYGKNLSKLKELIYNEEINLTEKKVLREQKINNIINILQDNQEKENILETIGDNIFLQIFDEAYEKEDTKLIATLFNDKEIAKEIIANDEKLDEHFKKFFTTSDLDVIESLIKNGTKFKQEPIGHINFVINNKKDFDKIKDNFDKLCKKYGIDYNKNELFYEIIRPTEDNNSYVIHIERINEKFTELSNEIKKQDELVEITKTIIEEHESTKESKEKNIINNKIITINSKIEVLKNLNKECKKQININNNKQLRKFCLPAIKNSKNENIFKEGFGGTTIVSKNNVKIKFDKDGFLRKTLENNSKTNKSILNILKNSLIIEYGKEWNKDKNSNKVELDTILMLFKKDPNIAFKMLIKLEEDKKIIIKKKGILLAKKLQQNEKEELQKAFEEVVKNRQEICDIINIKERILNNNYINRETRETIKKITDFGIKIIKCNKKNIIKNKKSNIDINNIKQKNIDNIINFLSFIEKNEDNIKNNENKINKILKNINNSIKAIDNSNKEDMIIALNNCIINIDNFDKNISNNVAVLQQA